MYNFSPTPKTIGKGVKIANGSCEYVEYDISDDIENVNVVADVDPFEVLCSTHELAEARSLLHEFKDVFSVSNNKIGCTNVIQFDVEVNTEPVSVPLHCIPCHHRDIVQQLINKYEQLNLVVPIDSPFRASTVLVWKKNLANSAGITDQYRLCTDYRSLNNCLFPSVWPSLYECLNAAGNSNMLSCIDFNSEYHQIPCTEHAKRALASSPGYGFQQLT